MARAFIRQPLFLDSALFLLTPKFHVRFCVVVQWSFSGRRRIHLPFGIGLDSAAICRLPTGIFETQVSTAEKRKRSADRDRPSDGISLCRHACLREGVVQ